MNPISHIRFTFLTHTNPLRTLFLLIAVLLGTVAAIAQTTSFTYQGRLNDGNSAANGSYDFQFKLFDAATAGNQIGTTNALNAVAVAGGGFTVSLDFGAGAFPGADRWLEVSIKPPNSSTFILLTFRQRVTATPYAIKSLNAATADGLSATCTGCITDAQIGGVAASKLTGALLPASVPDLGSSYIRNATTPQTNSNFNVSGNGTVGGTLTAGTVNSSALRQELTATAPNIINGFLGTFDGMLWSGNRVRGSVVGASIGGGGDLGQTGLGGEKTNQVTDSFGTVSGGLGNRAGRDNPTVGAGFADTVGGGYINVASGGEATVSGGYQNTASELQATVGGGFANTASSPRSTVGGGVGNKASAENATVGGGNNNIASGFAAAVSGGQNSIASGFFATVPGGRLNTASGDMSLAAGRRAKAKHQGAFVWGDSTDADFESTGNDQFLIRASGGVGIGTNTLSPSSLLTVNGVIETKIGGIKFPDGTTQITAAASGSFIQNSIAQQANSNFNISGNGTVGGTLTAGTLNSGALRQELTDSTPNIINGFLGTGIGGATPGNRVTAGVVGASIGGGGFNGTLHSPSGISINGDNSNRVTDWFGTVGGVQEPCR